MPGLYLLLAIQRFTSYCPMNNTTPVTRKSWSTGNAHKHQTRGAKKFLCVIFFLVLKYVRRQVIYGFHRGYISGSNEVSFGKGNLNVRRLSRQGAHRSTLSKSRAITRAPPNCGFKEMRKMPQLPTRCLLYWREIMLKMSKVY